MLFLQDKNTKLVLLGLATVAVVVGVCMNKKKLGNKSTLLCVGLSVGVALLVAMNLKEPVAVKGFYNDELLNSEEEVVANAAANAVDELVNVTANVANVVNDANAA